ncbi:MAG TPA: glycoside hydrolase family 38 C-terminal domain-containing protein, partial [Candidatus Lokiarchaeia archaeon]|nr:glycoside hydrolase family 38 C-terminal domain-containing protein [Candidatus Lokiarchaeia archaeon]
MEASNSEIGKYLPPRFFLEKVLEWANKHCPSIVNAAFKRAWAFKTNGTKVPIGGDGGVTVVSIGNSHIDAAWLWRKQDTINKKIPVTFARALNHFELHPLFTYSQNQAVYYKWVKESYPALFSLIKERIADGRWDYAGGDWVESDVNLPSGESLVRQRLHGQRFYLAEFGAVADVAWDDDVFGFPWSLPQILVKSGAKYWWTNKFGYNDTNFFPLTTWRWRGVDGTEILAHWSVHKNNFNKMLARMHNAARLCPPGKEIVLNTQTDWDTVSTEFSPEIAPVLANFYGNGDGGHGPTPMEILEQLTWARKGLVTLGTTKLLWNLLEPYRSRVPVWADELYLERHRGTLTSIHMIKENNRTAEILLQAVECIGVLGTLAGGSSLQAKIAQVWETVLFNQFHDVLPGSSIIEVYQDCGEEYKSLYAEMIPLAQETVSAIVSKSSEVSNEFGNILQSYALVNTVCWDRAGYFVIPRPLGEEHRIYLDNGKELGWQPISCSPWLPNRDIGLGATDPTGYQYMATIDGTRELVENSEVSLKYALIYLPPGEVVPAFGLRSIVVCEGAPAIPDPRVKLTDVPEEVILSNEMVEARISKQSGRVIYLGMPGDSGANLLREPGAGIQMYRDPDTEFPAWDIAADCFSRPILSPPVREVVPTEVGPLRAACVVKHALTSKGSEIWIFYALQAGDAKLYCEVWVNWQEEETFLKFDVPTTLDPANVQCEQPYAWIRRPTRPQTSMERARWEFAS